MVDIERINGLNVESERRYSRATVIDTVNAVYKRMAIAVGSVAIKIGNGQHINDRERETYNGWATTAAGICLLTGEERVDPISPLPRNIANDKFTITLNDVNGVEYKVPGRLQVQYMLDHLDTEISVARAQLIGTRDRGERKRISVVITKRLTEREILEKNSIPQREELPDSVADIISREANLISTNSERTYEDDVRNWLKGEKIIQKEERGLVLPLTKEGDYTAPWDKLTWSDLDGAFGKRDSDFAKFAERLREGIKKFLYGNGKYPYGYSGKGLYVDLWNKLTWEDLEAAFGLSHPDKSNIKTKDISGGVLDPNARGCLSLIFPAGVSDLFTIPWRDINRWLDEPVEKRVRSPWITVGGTEPLSDYHKQWERFSWDDIDASLGRRTDIFDYIRYSSREGYRLVVVGLGEFGEDLKYSVPESLRRRVDLTGRGLPEMEFKLPKVDRRWLALGLAALALVALKSCEKPAVAPAVGQNVKPEATAVPAPHPDYGTRGVFPKPAETPLASPEPKLIPETGFKGKSAEEPKMIKTKIEPGQTVKGIFHDLGRKAEVAEIDGATSIMVWVFGADNQDIKNLDLIYPGQEVLIRESVGEVMKEVNSDNPTTQKLIDRLNHVKNTPEARKEAQELAMEWYKQTLLEVIQRRSH